MKPVDIDTCAVGTDAVIVSAMKETFCRQRESFLREGPPPEVVRRNRIDRAPAQKKSAERPSCLHAFMFFCQTFRQKPVDPA